jgi:hypothetical protein
MPMAYLCNSTEARQRGAERLTILARPDAAGFYERNGAVRIGEAPSDAVLAICCRSIRSGSILRGDRDLGPYLRGRSNR